jgi:hypothetical protein
MAAANLDLMVTVPEATTITAAAVANHRGWIKQVRTEALTGTVLR